MNTLLDKIRNLQALEARATPPGPCEVQPQLRNGTIEVTGKNLRHICWVKTEDNAALIADMRNVIAELCSLALAQHEALKSLSWLAVSHRHLWHDKHSQALALATAEHPPVATKGE